MQPYDEENSLLHNEAEKHPLPISVDTGFALNANSDDGEDNERRGLVPDAAAQDASTKNGKRNICKEFLCFLGPGMQTFSCK